MSWIALFLALAAAVALAGLGSARIRKPRPSLWTFERQLLEGRPPLARAESKAHHETSRMSPDARKVTAHPLASGPEHLCPLLPVTQRGGAGGDGPLRVIVRFLGRLLLLLTGAPLLMVDPSEPNLPPIAADDMPAASNMVAKVQSTYSVEIEEDKVASMDLIQTKEISDNAPEEESEPEQVVENCQETTTALNEVFFDGLKFYKILTNVGRSAVQSAMDSAVARAAQSIVAKRPLPPSKRPDSIAFIRERYPDFICLLPTATHPTRINSSGSSHIHARRPHSDSFPPRLDLLSALLLSSSSTSSGYSATHRPPVKGEACAKEDEERVSSEQVRRAVALASPRAKQLDGGFLRVA